MAKKQLVATKRPRRPKDPNSISQLKKEADRLFSIYVLYRDGEKRADGWYSQCITDARWVKLIYTKKGEIDRRAIHWGHFQSSRHNSIRYHPYNVHAQCQICNIYNSGEQYRYSIQIDMRYGAGTAKKLEELSKQLHPFTREELLEIIARCQAYIDKVR